VLEFAASELGARMETSYGSARALMADALDIRHRLPQLWQLIVAGCVPSWRARKVAQATRHVSRDAAMQVDAAVAGCIATLPWGRFETLLAAKIIEADPRAAEEQARIWEAERFVRAGRTGQSGLKLLIAKANAGDVIWFMATVNRIAEILRLQGDLDSADVRRSKAIGILAQPALALQLLWEFRNEQHPGGEPQQPEEPIDNQVNAPFDNSTESPAEDPLDTASDNTASGAEPEPAHGDQPEPVGGGLIMRPSGLELGRLRPRVVLHIHLSHEALWAFTDGNPASSAAPPASKGSDPSPLARSAGSSPTPAVTSRCSRSSTRKTPHQWTVMRFRGGSAKPCSYGCRPAASPTRPGPTGWTLTTPSRMYRLTGVAHPAKPESTIWAR
jgi:hypothetical protein